VSLRDTIPAEVIGDPFAQELTRVAREEAIGTILEIGASSGEGSTRAIVQGMMQNPHRPRLFCLEFSRERFAALQARYADMSEVHCVNAASVPAAEGMDEEAIRDFCRVHRPFYPADLAVQWYREGLEYIAAENLPEDGIDRIKREHGIETFDMVVIDGGEFTGEAEWRRVDGARWVFLDDIVTAKNRVNHERLLRDPRYELVRCDETLRNGFSVFRRARTDLPLHFFTLVLNGGQFIQRHIEIFRQLTVPWTWHIVEGAAQLRHDTAWSVRRGGRLDDTFHRQGLSIDGTTAYLNALQAAFPDQVKVYRRKDGTLFDGKIEMVRAATAHVSEECLLWQIDADEFWTPEQIERLHALFMADGSRTAAWFAADFHVGPDRVIGDLNVYGNLLQQDWLRVWRFRPATMRWLAHEPPTLIDLALGRDGRDVGRVHPFTQHETAAAGLVFRHEAYVAEEQLAFKETYYGYANAVADWRALQAETNLPVPVRSYFSWVSDRPGQTTLVDYAERAALSRTLPVAHHRARAAAAAGRGAIVIDGLFWARSRHSGIAQVWNNLLAEWQGTPLAERLVIVDRDRTAPRLPGFTYADLPAHRYEELELDRRRLQSVCDFYAAGRFLSTYYSRPLHTPSVFVAYDMIPERGWFPLELPMWREKARAIDECAAVVSISRATLSDLHELFPSTRTKPALVMPLASRLQPADPAAQADFRQRHGLVRPFWLLVGASPYYKNCGYFFDALRQLRTRHQFDIVCASPHGLDAFRGEFPLREFLFSDADLAAAYSAAEALVFPSKIEGFGLPLVEAMQCGCPVLALDTPIHREVCGDAALLCDGDNPASLAHELGAVQVEPVRRELVERGRRRARQFSWEVAAAQLRDFLLAPLPTGAAVRPAPEPALAGR
jgi:glycosyltransferase involved in cell wall biosynthesis